jgi:dTDP-4-amino-4,6-dideoxygalactose transaminase
LKSLPAKVARRRALNQGYRAAFESVPGIAFMPEADYGTSSCWLTCITVAAESFGATREDIRLRLESEDIESRPLWKPMHLQPVFKDCLMRGGAVSEDLFERGLCLPSGSGLTSEQQARITAIVAGTPVARRRSARDIAHA